MFDFCYGVKLNFERSFDVEMIILPPLNIHWIFFDRIIWDLIQIDNFNHPRQI